MGIGVDNIPQEIKNSNTLTGNNLGMLANVEALPNQQDVDNFANDNKQYLGLETQEKHKFAQQFLENNDVESAWKVLLIK